MYQKNCYTCHRASFSSVEYGGWLGPTCGEDLSVQKAFDALIMERINMPHRLNKKGNVYNFKKKRT
ncbi:UNVERIFIED_ORG: hypothetical protein ABIC97_000821 [Peribacillus simplex]